MMPLVLLGLLACAAAAPHHHHGHGPPPPFPRHYNHIHQRFFQDDIFDTRSFWDELQRELLSLDTIVDDFVKHFPSSVSDERIDGDVYRITIPLPGFEEKDIVVKARKGLAMIQAVHSAGDGVQKTYMDVRMLPACVDESGNWSYDNEILKVEFPLSERPTTPAAETDTEAPALSREEMEPHTDDGDRDADVGSERGDLAKGKELLTNELPRRRPVVEATTYAVDLKDEVEFVPIRKVK